MAINYASSGLGWLCDERFFKRLHGHISTVDGRKYSTRQDGAIIFATVYISTIHQTGAVVLANEDYLAAYDQGRTQAQGSFSYKGFRWYITQFRYWRIGDFPDDSGISQKLSFNTDDYEMVGKGILDAASLCRDEDFTDVLERVYYNGKSKVIKRLCQLINNFNRRAMLTEIYDTNHNGVVDDAEKVNGHEVHTDVPPDAVFTDTIYDDTAIQLDVRSAQNNIQILMDQVFNSNMRYLVDADGYHILDSEGHPIIVGDYEPKIPENLIERLQALEASVTDLESRKYIYWSGPANDNQEGE